MKTRILIIDNDPESLLRCQEAINSKNGQWELEAHATAAAASAAIERRVPEVVIASYRLEGPTNGVELLKTIERLQPDIQRFIFASLEDKPELEAHIGSCFQFLPKPCSADHLLAEIQRGLAIDSWLGNEKVKDIIHRMGEFPSLPPLYLKVMNALNSSNASAASVGEAISGDIAISAKLLQTVNSSFFGLEEKVSDITQAVGILGLDSVKHLVLAIQVFGALGRSPEQKALTDQLWHHSMSVALAAKRIARYETDDSSKAEEAYTAGLLHDLGQLVMLNAVPEAFAQARELAKVRSIPLWQAENKIIGCNHAETGAFLLGRWGMPTAVVEAVAFHHQPNNSHGNQFACLTAVHAANALVWQRKAGDASKIEAQADELYLQETGKAGSWPLWQELAAGKKVDSIAARKGAAPTADAPADRADAKRGAPTDPSRRSLAPLAIGLAAGVALAASLYFVAKVDSDPATTQSPSLAQAAPPASFDFPEAPIEPSAPGAATDWEDAFAEETTDPAAVVETLPEPAIEPAAEDSSAEPTADLEVIAPEEVDVALSETEAVPAQPAEPEPLKPSFPQIALAGIFYNADNPLASINGRIRRVGDTVDGAEIVSIERTRIIVSFENETRTIVLK